MCFPLVSMGPEQLVVCGQTWEREPPSTPAKTMLGLLKKIIVLSYYSSGLYYVFRRRKYTLEIWSPYVKSVTHKIVTSLFLFKIGPSGVRALSLGVAVKLSSLCNNKDRTCRQKLFLITLLTQACSF